MKRENIQIPLTRIEGLHVVDVVEHVIGLRRQRVRDDAGRGLQRAFLRNAQGRLQFPGVLTAGPGQHERRECDDQQL